MNTKTATFVIAMTAGLGLAAASSFAAPAASTTAQTAAQPPSGSIPVNQVPDPQNTLKSAKIVDLSGNSVGSVDQLLLDANGKPARVKVDVGGFLGIGAKDVALDANALKFDPAKKVLITTMTKEQLKALPEFKG